tara:strand:- start:581 stop:1033 length:453 start_codon:yes stop_codon:yes gene_type:complete
MADQSSEKDPRQTEEQESENEHAAEQCPSAFQVRTDGTLRKRRRDDEESGGEDECDSHSSSQSFGKAWSYSHQSQASQANEDQASEANEDQASEADEDQASEANEDQASEASNDDEDQIYGHRCPFCDSIVPVVTAQCCGGDRCIMADWD